MHHPVAISPLHNATSVVEYPLVASAPAPRVPPPPSSIRRSARRSGTPPPRPVHSVRAPRTGIPTAPYQRNEPRRRRACSGGSWPLSRRPISSAALSSGPELSLSPRVSMPPEPPAARAPM